MRQRLVIAALIAVAAGCSGSDSPSGPPAFTLTIDGVPPSATAGDTLLVKVRVFTPTGYGAGLPVTFTVGEGVLITYSDTTSATGRDSATWVLPSTPARLGARAYLTNAPTYQTPQAYVQVSAP